MAERPRRLWLAACLIAALLGAVLYEANPLSRGAEAHAREVAAASGAVYLTLRSLNAFLSTAQEVEVGGSVVVQGSVHPLKVLEPVDDTIERIADQVFFVMLLTGILAVATGPASAVGCALLAAGLALALVWRGPGGAALARALGVYGFLLAVAAPLSLVLSSGLSERMTAQVWDRHQVVIAEISAGVEPDIAASEPSSGWWILDGWRQDIDRYGALAASISERADDLVASFVAILAVFFFRILILPLLLLGGCVLVARHLARA